MKPLNLSPRFTTFLTVMLVLTAMMLVSAGIQAQIPLRVFDAGVTGLELYLALWLNRN
jgi:hypothetical protein